MNQALAKRLLTSLVGIPAVLAVVFYLPGDAAFAVFFLAFFWAAVEFVRLARGFAPSAPLGSLLLLIPLAAAGTFLLVRQGIAGEELGMWLSAAAGVLVVITACTTLLAGTEVREGLISMGILAFAVPYFAVPPVSLYRLQRLDPWLVVLLLAIVWLGDSAAYVFGKWIGRHKLAPVISPNKTWEGTIAGLLASLLGAAVWSLARLGELPVGLLAVALATAVASQLGDLVESLVKRGAGVKDSSHVLPGHGGFYDRLDGMLLATPIFLAGIRMLGSETLIPPP